MFDGDPGDESDLDAIAAEQAAAQAERDRIDAAASLAFAQGALNKSGQQQHPTNSEEAEDDLPWWEDAADTPPLDIVVDLTNAACGRTHYLGELEKLGLDLSPTTGYVGLNAKTGPLVVAALQILGVLHSHLRDEITKVLNQCSECIPTFGAEFTDEMERIVAQYEEQRMREFAAAMGVNVMSPDEYAEKLVEDIEQRADASNN